MSCVTVNETTCRTRCGLTSLDRDIDWTSELRHKKKRVDEIIGTIVIWDRNNDRINKLITDNGLVLLIPSVEYSEFPLIQ